MESTTKPFYRSTGIIAGLAVVAASIMGMDVTQLDFQSLFDNLNGIFVSGLGLWAAYGRLKATTKVVIRQPAPEAPPPVQPTYVRLQQTVQVYSGTSEADSSPVYTLPINAQPIDLNRGS